MRLEKTARLIELARDLAASAEGMTLDEIAQWGSVNRRTAERMRDAIRHLYPQLEEISEGRQIRYRIPGGLDRLTITPTVEELAELALARQRLMLEGQEARAEALRGLELKLRAAMRAAARARIETDMEALLEAEAIAVSPGPRPRCPPGHLAAIREAVKALRTVRFSYVKDADAEWREVVPYGVLFGRSYFLVGPALGKPDPVLWRIDRMVDVEVGPNTAARPDDFDLKAFAARSVGVFQEEPQDVSLVFAASAASEVERTQFHIEQKLEPLPDGRMRVRFRAGGMLELAWYLVTWGSTVTIEAPESLEQALDDVLKRSAARGRSEQATAL